MGESPITKSKSEESISSKSALEAAVKKEVHGFFGQQAAAVASKKIVSAVRDINVGSTVQEIVLWLRCQGLEKYAEIFQKNDVNGAAFHLLSKLDLQEMGIASVGAQKLLLMKIQELK